MPDVRPERTGWRDLELSKRHRMWGWDCPAVDLDFLFLEYDKGEPVALIEYKNEHAPPQFASHPTYQAMIRLGTRAGCPVFCARYKSDFSQFRVVPLNDLAKGWITRRAEMTEREFVSFLYRIRGYEAPTEMLDALEVFI